MIASKCSFNKRSIAFLIDISIVWLAALLFNYLIAYPIAYSTTSLKQDYVQMNYEKIQTHLYKVVDKNYKIIDTTDVDKEKLDTIIKENSFVTIKDLARKSKDYTSLNYLEDINYYYSIIEKTESYNNYFKDNKDFELKDGNYHLVSTLSEEEKISAVDNLFSIASKDLNQYKDQIILKLGYKVSSINLIIISAGYLITSLIFLLFVPLFSKHKNTIGKKILHLGVVDKYYVNANGMILTVRYLSLMIIEFALSVITFGGFIIGSMIMVLMTSNGISIHDFLATSQVVDLKEFTPFNNRLEYDNFINQEKQNLKDSLNKVYEN